MLIYPRFEENELVQSDLGTQVVFLRNDIWKKLATLFGPNHKWAVKPQSLFCFLAEKPNQSQADRTDSLFENVESKSSQKRK